MDSIWHRTSKQSTLDSVKRGHLHSARIFQGAVSTCKSNRNSYEYPTVVCFDCEEFKVLQRFP